MGTSVFIAKIFGLTYLVVAVGLLLNQATFKQVIEDFCKSVVAVFYGGILSLVIGIVIVLTHNIWKASWVALITIIGWGGLIKGIWMIVFPNSVFKFMEAYLRNEGLVKAHGILALVFGLALTYFGFFAK